MNLSTHDGLHKWHSITTLYYYAEGLYAECHFLFVVMLSAIMLNVVILSASMFSIVAPNHQSIDFSIMD
jgi:hypothetical protein